MAIDDKGRELGRRAGERSGLTEVFPTITAHTGCDGTAENTVESAVTGLRLGADYAEVDVRVDPDGVLFLWHHDVVRLRDGSTIPVQPLRIRELRSLGREGKVAAGEPAARAATFEELAAAVVPTGGRVNLDLKDDRSVELIGEAVRIAGLANRVVVTGCEIGRVRLVRERSPSLPVYLNTKFGGTDPDSLSRGRIDEECRIAAGAGCGGINVHLRLCTPLLVEAARAHALEVSVWTIAPADGFARFVDMGVDNITTRHVAELVAFRADRHRGGLRR